MTWTPEARTFLLDTNEHFHARYCEQETLDRLLWPKPAGAPQSPQVASLRRIVCRLSELMPNAAHSSPNWSTRPRPVIGIGYMDRGGSVKGAMRIGVCQQDGQLFLVVDGRIAEQFADLRIGRRPEWLQWGELAPAKSAAKTMWRFTSSIDLAADAPPPVGHPLHSEHAVGRFLSSIGRATDYPTKELQASVQPHRIADEAPRSLSAIYPALFRRWRQKTALVNREF